MELLMSNFKCQSDLVEVFSQKRKKEEIRCFCNFDKAIAILLHLSLSRNLLFFICDEYGVLYRVSQKKQNV